MVRLILAAAVVALFATESQAGVFRNRRSAPAASACSQAPATVAPVAVVPAAPVVAPAACATAGSCGTSAGGRSFRPFSRLRSGGCGG